MTEIIASLGDIARRYDVLLCDLWGCLHDGIHPFPDAVAALQAFRTAGGRVVLLTNAPRPEAAVRAHLNAMGVPTDCYDVIVSSGDAAQEAMLAGLVGDKVFHIGAKADENFFTTFSDDIVQRITIARVPLDQAEGVICTGLADDRVETPDMYREVLLGAKARGLKMICANPDIMVDKGENRLYCAGALAALYEEMGGEALYFGKPHAPVYELARRRLAAMDGKLPVDERMLCIGDGIATDVQGGMAEGLETLFITGGLAGPDIPLENGMPDAAALQAYLARHQQSPTAAIGFLR
ncbi:TIGR01459 family HAD-type hydrolase [Abyssibius alkaniclasticus]|uniref:TIGR01459 family HAD-type hydrolase n=1 Tax=Abyssibius alkaniclasticus TaxID=2881234 RepID=UPI00236489AF|nr:TIGR01459 family HAD-type hydrolase [Abyssibius alkaniclasticus]UPH71538.1 TIGR01459 family HAD-type hydrolase [Abyssibius alkaniclasticus]